VRAGVEHEVERRRRGHRAHARGGQAGGEHGAPLGRARHLDERTSVDGEGRLAGLDGDGRAGEQALDLLEEALGLGHAALGDGGPARALVLVERSPERAPRLDVAPERALAGAHVERGDRVGEELGAGLEAHERLAPLKLLHERHTLGVELTRLLLGLVGGRRGWLRLRRGRAGRLGVGARRRARERGQRGRERDRQRAWAMAATQVWLPGSRPHDALPFGAGAGRPR
jgi:hypothetical protein